MRNLGCEVGTSFDVCAVQPLDCIVRKAWNAHAVQVEPPFETVDTRFTFLGTRNHIHSAIHQHRRYHDDLNTTCFIFRHLYNCLLWTCRCHAICAMFRSLQCFSTLGRISSPRLVLHSQSTLCGTNLSPSPDHDLQHHLIQSM